MSNKREERERERERDKNEKWSGKGSGKLQVSGKKSIRVSFEEGMEKELGERKKAMWNSFFCKVYRKQKDSHKSGDRNS